MKRSLIILGRLWKVQAVNYFQDVTNITLGIILTTLTMVCWLSFKTKEGGLIADPFLLASAIGISVIRNSQYNLNLTLTDWKVKGFFNHISSTPLSKRFLVGGILSFNWFINIMVAMLLFSIAMLFEEQRAIIVNVNWPIFLSGFILNVWLSNIMAISLMFVAKRRDGILVLSYLSYYGPMYFLGLGIPWNVVGNIEGLNYFLYLWPHRYPLALMQSGWIWNHTPNLQFPLAGDPTLPGGVTPDSFLHGHGFGFGEQLWIPIVASIGLIFLFALFFSLRIKHTFEFGRRGLKTYKGISQHLDYISQIKKSKSLTELDAVINQMKQENPIQKNLLPYPLTKDNKKQKKLADSKEDKT